MVKKSLTFILLFFYYTNFAQTVNSWFDLFSVQRLYKVTASDEQIYAAGRNAILIYDLKDKEIQRLSTFSGLSDHDISDILYAFDMLTVVYKTGNIDLIRQNQILNLPYVMDETSILDKQLTSITASNTAIYIGGHFGVLKLDPQKLIISQACNFQDAKVTDLAFWDGNIFAATDKGIYYIGDSVDISIFENWHFIPISDLRQLKTNGQNLFFSKYDDNHTTIYKFDYYHQDSLLTEPDSQNFYVSDKAIYLFSDHVSLYTLTGLFVTDNRTLGNYKHFYINDLIEKNRMIIAADAYNGIDINLGEQNINFQSTYSDNVDFIKAFNDKLYITYKPDSIDKKLGTTAVLSIKTDNNWQHYIFPEIHDYFTTIAVDPSDDNHLFLGTSSYGLYEFRDGKIITSYNSINSPLKGINGKIEITALRFDNEGNLWVLSPSETYPIVRKNADGTWDEIIPSSVAAGLQTDKFIFTEKNEIWANLFSKGFLAIDLNTQRSRVFYPSRVVGNSINGMTEDKDGTIWYATSDGLAYLVYDSIFNAVAIRPTVQVVLNDTTIYVYLLDNVKVSDIQTDPANRKWVSTTMAGIYLLNDDCSKQLASFNRFSGNFPTNIVYRIFMDNPNGTVYFTTDIGLVGYYTDATRPTDNLSQVKIVPNPVRPGFNGLITISGLMYNTLVKITDLEGNVVYETRSNGGTATWDGHTLDGRLPHSGVYLIFCVDETGKFKCVKKLLIIR